MKIILSLLLVLIIISLFLVAWIITVKLPKTTLTYTRPIVERPLRTSPEFNGTFIQSWLCASFSDERYEAEIKAMKEAGIKYLVLADVACKGFDKEGGKWTFQYPTKIPEVANNCTLSSVDVIEKTLMHCEKAGIKVFLGMGMYDDFWVKSVMGKEYRSFIQISEKIAEEIYHTYYNKYPNAFYGFYFVPEISNNAFNVMPFIKRAAEGFNVIIDKLNSLNKEMPLLLSPYFNEYYTYADIRKTEEMWVKFFKYTNFREGDIFCPQDAVGAAWVKMEHLESVWEMYYNAVKRSEKNIKLWANCENFIQPHNGGNFSPPKTENTEFIPSPLDRFVKQLQIASKYSENIISFSYNHYYSPAYITDIYHKTYLDYLKSYQLETVKPSAPKNAYKSKIGNGIELNFMKSTDNFGVVAYRILKDGEFLQRLDMKQGGIQTHLMVFNTEFDSTYEIEAIDAAGNISERTLFKAIN